MPPPPLQLAGPSAAGPPRVSRSSTIVKLREPNTLKNQKLCSVPKLENCNAFWMGSPSKFQLGAAVSRAVASRTILPGLVQCRATYTPLAIRSTRCWKPRSFTSKPGEVKLVAAPHNQLPASLSTYTSPLKPASDVRVES